MRTKEIGLERKREGEKKKERNRKVSNSFIGPSQPDKN